MKADSNINNLVSTQVHGENENDVYLRILLNIIINLVKL